MAIKIVTIITRMNLGGPAVLLHELVNGLPKEEFEHVLVTGICDENEIDFLTNHSFPGKILRIKSMKRNSNPLLNLLTMVNLSIILLREKPDIIHTHIKSRSIGTSGCLYSFT